MIGQTISHYKILEKLGEGGMGVVYKAEDLTLGRTVALKFLPPDSVAREEDRARLVHEARAAAALLHPNICPIHEIAEADGRTFIVMAHIEGRSLKARISEGPLPLDEALSIARQIGDALAAAHAKGVIHRDIKPANIMLTAEGRPMLMDFGLAKMSGATRVTRTGTTVGTVAYMSPEQARGEEIDQRSDVWSLGAVLYEMLAGRVPFPGDYDQAVIYGILHEEPESISRLRPEVPAAAVRVLEGALRKDPRERYSSMRELLVDLESSVEGRGSWRLRAKRLFLGRRRRAVAVALLVAVVAAGGWLLLQRPGAVRSGNLALAVMDFEDLGGSGDTLAAAGLNGLLQVGLIEKSPIRVVSPEYLQELHRRLFNGAIGVIRPERATEVARKAGASFILSGQLGGQKGSTYVIWRLIETGRGRSVGGRRVVYSDIVGLADEIIAEVVPLIAKPVGIDTPIAIGSVEQITSSSPEALRHFTAAEVILEGGKEDEALRQLEIAVRLDSTFALAWLRMADVYSSHQESIPAKKYADKAWALRSRLSMKDRMMLESRRLQLDFRITEGMDVYREMMSRWPDDRTIVSSYSSALFWWSFWPEAGAVAQEGLARFPDDEDLLYLRTYALIYQGKETDALASARELQRRHPGKVAGWNAIGEAHLFVGAIDSAEVAFRRANDLAPDDFRLQLNLARCAFFGGQPMAALAILERLLTRASLSPNERFGLIFGNVYTESLANCYAEIGRLNRALQMYDDWDRGEGSADPEKRFLSGLTRSFLLLDWGRPQAVLAWARDMSRGPDTLRAKAADVMRVVALTDLDSLQAARAGLTKLRAMKDIPAFWGRYMPHSIAARIALAEGHPDSALAQLEGIQVAMNPWDYETRARALCALKRFPEAAAALKEDLRCYGSRFIARYQLGQIYEEMGREADAARQYEIFLKAWENADPGWPQVEDARKRLVALQSTTPK
jgi:predicted Zn-dependent protease/predicted Ser/Thr protein kinase/TolB-like protein